MMPNSPNFQRPPRPPTRRTALGEARVLADLAGMALPLLRATRRSETPGVAAMVLPGFGGDDRWTWPLRRMLGAQGHQVDGWGLGRNLAGIDIRHRRADIPEHWGVQAPTPYRGEGSVILLCERVRQRVEARSRQLGRPLVLIGWSLGGYIAREVARDSPECVQHVVTLGSPVIGGPKYSVAAPFFWRRGMDLDWIEREIARRDQRPIGVPITAVVSSSDGVVDPAACVDRNSPRVRHIEIDASHVGLVFNARVWRIVSEVLSRGLDP